VPQIHFALGSKTGRAIGQVHCSDRELWTWEV